MTKKINKQKNTSPGDRAISETSSDCTLVVDSNSDYTEIPGSIRDKIVQFHKETDTNQKEIIQAEIRKAIAAKSKNETLHLNGLDLSHLDLSHLDLTNISFTHSTCDKTNFSYCILDNTIFLGRDNVNRNKISAYFIGAKVSDKETEIDFTNCNLSGAIFTGSSIISNIKLSNALLSETVFAEFSEQARQQTVPGTMIDIFKEVSFEGANLSDLVLSNLNLQRTFYRNTILNGAKFNNSNISGANFSEAIDLKPHQIINCKGYNSAYLPKGFPRKRPLQENHTITDFFSHNKCTQQDTSTTRVAKKHKSS